MAVFEYSVAILTAIRTYQAFRLFGMEGHRGGLLRLIVEQGIFYFSIVSFISTASVALNLAAPSGFLQRLLNALRLPLSGLLTARFLLHLQAWEEKQTNPDSFEQSDGSQQDATVGGFRALGSDTIGSITRQFGEDPVEVAQRRGDDVRGTRRGA